MLEGSCHCGAVRIRLPGLPAYGNRCRCSICRRYGLVWGYFPHATVAIIGHPEATVFYARDPKGLRFVRCRGCGCVTHWEPPADDDGRIGINLNLFEPSELDAVPVRETEGPP